MEFNHTIEFTTVSVSPRAADELPVYNAEAMTLSKTTRLLLALISGVALAFAFAIFNFPLLAWISVAILILAVLNATPQYALLLGWLHGVAFYAVSVPWFYSVMRHYGPLSVPAAGGVFMLVVFVSAIFRALFASGVAWLGRFGAAPACLAAPFLWVSTEFLFLHFPHIGFPWNLLGYAAAGNLAFAQLTAITGIFGLSLGVATYNALIAWTAVQAAHGKTAPVRTLLAVSVALIVIALAGPRFVPQAPADHVAHLVQTNFPVSTNYPANWMQTHASDLDDLERTSIGAAEKIPGIVVWPEVPAPFSLQDAQFLTRATRIARGSGGGFLGGVLDW